MAMMPDEQKNQHKKNKNPPKDAKQNAQYGKLLLARQLKELQKNSV